MKTVFVFVLMLGLNACLISQSQTGATNRFFTLGIGGGLSGKMLHVSYDNISKKGNWTAIGFRIMKKADPSVPSNYYGGMKIFDNAAYPHASTYVLTLSRGLVLQTGSPHWRLILGGGIAIGGYQKPADFKQTDPHAKNLGEAIAIGIFEPNYTFRYKRGCAGGLVLNPKLDFPIFHGLGISVGPVANINTVGSTYGLEVSLHFGRVRDRKQGRE